MTRKALVQIQLPADPVAALEAATKQYVDNRAVVAALPGSPVDGQIAYYQSAAMATANILWVFRYRSAATTYKWEFVGGSPWWAEVMTSQAPAVHATNYVDFATVGPSITAPLTGEYLISFGALMIPGVNSQGWMVPKIGVAAAVDADATGMGAGDATAATAPQFRQMVRVVTAADVVKLVGRSVGTATGMGQRTLCLQPKRVA